LPISPPNFFYKKYFYVSGRERESAAVEKREHNTLRALQHLLGNFIFSCTLFCFLRFNVTEKMEKRRRRRRSLRVKEGDVKKFGKGDDGPFLYPRAATTLAASSGVKGHARRQQKRTKNAPGGSLHKSRAFVSARQKVKQIMAAAGDNTTHNVCMCESF